MISIQPSSRQILSPILLWCLLALFGMACNPCDKIDCGPNGYCLDGECQCDTGYSGSRCNRYEPCEDISCENGGTCLDGRCQCPPGFTGQYCQKTDPCYGVTCLNGGECESGNCDCPTGYYGNQCQYVRSPIGFRLEKIVLTSFQENNEGLCWDSDGTCYPDPYFRILLGNDLAYISSFRKDLTTGDEYAYSSGLPFTFDVHQTYLLELKDWDYGSAEKMAAGNLKMIDFAEGFRSLIPLSNADFAFELHGEWLF